MTRVRQLPRQVFRTLSRPLQLTPAPFGQLPVAAAEAASTRCLLFVRTSPRLRPSPLLVRNLCFARLPAGGRPLYLIILPPLALRHNNKADPAGSGPAACRPTSDLVIGNQGLNNAFEASVQEPMTLYGLDFDGNGVLDPVLSYYIQDTAYPIYSRDDLMDHLPYLKKKFPDYSDYARAGMGEIFGDKLKQATVYQAHQLATIYLHQTGDRGFELRSLPVDAQLSPVYAICAGDLNHDGYPDLVLAGNNAWNRIKFGRYRGNHGLVLINDGKGNFSAMPQQESNLRLRGDVRSMELMHGKGGDAVGGGDE